MIAVLPFFSVQDKNTGVQLTDVCCVSRMASYQARKLGAVLFWPNGASYDPPGVELRRIDIPPDNRTQRLELPRLDLAGIDALISHRELDSAVLKRSVRRVVQVNHLLPLGINTWMLDRQRDSLEAADAVAVMNKTVGDVVQRLFGVQPHVCSFNWNDEEVLWRPVDFLFSHRCSASDYSGHREFVAAAEALRGRARFVLTDPSGYLQKHEPSPHVEILSCPTRESYFALLRDVRYVVCSMKDDMAGGAGVREAIASGAAAICCDEPCYKDLGAGFYRRGRLVQALEPLARTLETVRAESYSKGLAALKELL